MNCVDLNADLGEGFGVWALGDDEGLLDVVTSANVACGFHAGDASTMRRVCAAAAERKVSIGAQVGYRDLAGFGRRFVDIAPDELAADVLYQVGALDGIARAEGTRVRYVKPHGALYNAIVHHEQQAAAVVSAVLAYAAPLGLYGLPGSEFLRQAAAAGLPTVPEAFADRAYLADGTLVPRSTPGAVLHDAPTIAARVRAMVTEGRVVSTDGVPVALAPGSICVHGDTPDALRIARSVRAALAGAGVDVRAVF